MKYGSLRKLELRDAQRMLEWMHDDIINQWFKYPFSEMTLEKVEEFIRSANELDESRHFAITNEKDEYCGTISLKNIDLINSSAELAIVLRHECHGTGMAEAAFNDILNVAFFSYSLHKVYLNVLCDNERAINFYKKVGMREEGEFRDAVKIKNSFKNLKWFGIIKGEQNALD